MSFADKIPSSQWQEKVWTRMWSANVIGKPPISDNDLQELYQHLYQCKVDSEQRSLDSDIPQILNVFEKNKTEGTYLIAEHIVKMYLELIIALKVELGIFRAILSNPRYIEHHKVGHYFVF